MIGLYASRRRADDFATLVETLAAPPYDGAVDGPGDATRTAARATGSVPGASPLLGVVRQLRSASGVMDAATPSPAFSAELRSRLMAEAARAPVERPAGSGGAGPHRTRPAPRQRRVAILATAGLVVCGTAGMSTAAQRALPGDTLYPVKRGIERVDVSLSRSPSARGHDLLAQASTRLEEARRLVVAGGAASTLSVPATLTAFAHQEDRGSDLLLESYSDSRDPAAVVTVRTSVALAMGALRALSGSVPDAARTTLVTAAQTLHGIDARATEVCSSCSNRPSLPVPGALATQGAADPDTEGETEGEADGKTDGAAPRTDRQADLGAGPVTEPGEGMPGTDPGTGPGATSAPAPTGAASGQPTSGRSPTSLPGSTQTPQVPTPSGVASPRSPGPSAQATGRPTSPLTGAPTGVTTIAPTNLPTGVATGVPTGAPPDATALPTGAEVLDDVVAVLGASLGTVLPRDLDDHGAVGSPSPESVPGQLQSPTS